ncbi:metallophosphoesterase family protein [Alkalibacterium sp. f15]|uniref:metallophosphoesterase family protein n=1 Tax=Alkalibacterium sp. f15 TaxID=3414029 RepID=UPI003BF87C0D
MVRYIHAADLHLDSPFKGLKNMPEALFDKIKASTFDSLRKIVDVAIHHRVDFVLVAGDVYDIEDRSIRAQVLLRKELERLNDADISVYLIHGNHDYITNDELHLSLPKNVEVFGPEVETKIHETANKESIAISGFSYDRNWVEDRKIKDYPLRNRTVNFHIGLLHGYLEGQNTEHARYAPFTLTELKEKNYDYWALGHIHKRQQLGQEPLVYYSGNTQGRHKNEQGEKGCLLVELTNTNEKVTFIPTADITWQSVTLDVTSYQAINKIFEDVKKELTKDHYKNCLVDLTLEVSENIPSSVMRKLDDDDFYQAFQQIETTSFVYIASHNVLIRREESRLLSLESSFPTAWNKALADVKKEEVFQTLTHELFSMHTYAKYSDENNEKYRNDIITAAERLLLQDLGDAMSHDY